MDMKERGGIPPRNVIRPDPRGVVGGGGGEHLLVGYVTGQLH